MRRLTWQAGTALVAVSLCLAAAQQPALASTEEEIARLRQIILEQQERFAAQEKRLAEQERRLQEQSDRLAEQERKLSDQQRISQSQGLILSEQRGDLEDLYARFEYVGDWDTSPYDLSDRGTLSLVQGVAPKAPVPVAPGESGPTTPSAPARDPDVPDSPEGQRPESEKPTDQLLLEVGGILLPPGTLQVEPAVEYTYSDSDQIGINGFTIFEAIVIGNISVDDVERNIIRSSVTTRLGVYDRVQIDAFVPYIYRQDRITDSVGTDQVREEDTDGHGIGDVQFGVSYQPIIGQGAIPDLIVRSRASFPTGKDAFDINTKTLESGEQVLKESPRGSGFYALENTMTGVWTSDPVVFFAGGGYTFNFEENKNGTDIDPGDTVQFFAGLNVALNENVSLNLSFTDQITFKTEVDGSKQDGSSFNDGRIILGSSIGVLPDVSLLFAAAAGVTDEAPDFQFTVSVPVTMSIF